MDDIIREFQQSTNHLYRSRVMKNYQKSSGIDIYNFKVIDPSNTPYQYLLADDDKTVSQVDPFASCLIVVNNEIKRTCVSIKKFPKLSEAVLLVGQCLYTKDKIQRYLSLFKSYECICNNHNYEYSSIRHGLSHPESVLTNKKTIENLRKIFGTTKINLNDYGHLRKFYKYLGKLLIDNDDLLYKELANKINILRFQKGYKRILLGWQVKGFNVVTESAIST